MAPVRRAIHCRERILVMGGTRFIGKPLVAQLLRFGHELTLFTAAENPVPGRGGASWRAIAATPRAPGAAAKGEAFYDREYIDSSGRSLLDQPAPCSREPAPAETPLCVC